MTNHKDATGHREFETFDADVRGAAPRPFQPITDCPGCSTVTAHVFAYRDADPNADLVEIVEFGSATTSYIPTGALEPYTERECFSCGRKWAEDLPDEWRAPA